MIKISSQQESLTESLVAFSEAFRTSYTPLKHGDISPVNCTMVDQSLGLIADSDDPLIPEQLRSYALEIREFLPRLQEVMEEEPKGRCSLATKELDARVARLREAISYELAELEYPHINKIG